MPTCCALCDHSLLHHPILEGDRGFCCTGCHTVFHILLAKNQLQNYQDSPIFRQALQCGLISNPALIEEIRKNTLHIPENELEKLHLEVCDMWCPACAEIIKLILQQQKGIRTCVVDYTTDLASIEFAPRYISKEKIFELISGLGYKPRTLQEAAAGTVSFDLYLRFIVAAFCSLNIMMVAYPLYATYFDYDPQDYGSLFAWVSMGLSLPVMFYSGWPILQRFWNSIKLGLFGMETLVVMGVTAAFGLSTYELFTGGTRVYYDSMTVIIVFVLLGKIIESKAKFSAKDSLLHLTRALPRRGRKRFSDGTEAFVPVKEIEVGDLVTVFAGEKIVLEGVVVEGEGMCDESLMTGESLPVPKSSGFKVLSGTVLQQGRLTFKATSTGDQSALKKIIEMVEQDITHKTLYVRSADRIVRWFVPAVIGIAFLTGILCYALALREGDKSVEQTAVLRAMAVLLISCPCAIGIAAPLAESHLLNALAGLGAIVRNRGCLRLLGRETTFICDKTGTITEGRFTILEGLEKLTTTQKEILKGISSQSIHPIASAVSCALTESPKTFSRIEEVIGKGLRADGEYYLGSYDFLKMNQIAVNEEPAAYTTIYFASKQQLLTRLVLGDRIREGASDLVKSLAPAKTVLLSGDAEAVVQAVAQKCGFNAYVSGCSPLQKRDYVDSLRAKGEIVAMLGDGINDAPALTGAHVGISVVSATDLSIQVSDILLTTDRLSTIPKIRTLAIKGRKILKQNLFWAFFYNVIGIGLAAFGWLSPIFAAFAMVASSLMVMINARRI